MSGIDEVAWLRAALGDEAQHPLLFSSAGFGSCQEPGFWRLSPEIEDFRPIAEMLLPRQGAAVMVTDSLGEGDRRHFVGLQIAALLAERGRRVVLVDAELEQAGFSRSLPDSEREGWADLVLYGASPAATVGAAPLVGLRMLSAGSVRPAPGERLDAEGIRRGLSQLKHEFDCVLILRAAQTARHEWSELFFHCDGALLVTGNEEPRAAELVGWLREHGIKLWGAAVFGKQALDVALAVEGTLSEDFEATDAPAAVPPRPNRASARDGAADGHASSPAFRYATIALLAALLGFVGWWAWSQRAPDARLPPRERLSPQRTALLEQPEAEPADDAAQPPEATEESTAEPALEIEDDLPAPDDDVAAYEPPARAASAVTIVDASTEILAETTPAEPDRTPPPPTQTPRQEPAGDAAAETDAAEGQVEAEPAVPAAQIQESGSDPLLLPVGPGWALHPWSFPDSNEALSALGPLLRRGMKPAVRGFVLEERGRWYRVLVGRFATRAQAMDARERLTDVRGIDWVGVVQIP
jgi:hypothetical protein